jgi:hypothetical protein
LEQDLEQIKAVIENVSRKYVNKGGAVRLAAVEGGTIKVSPTGFCWR